MDAEWFDKVRSHVVDVPSVELRHIPPEHPLDEPTRPRYEPTPRYVAVAEEFPDDSLDFVLVDGHYRQACILNTLAKLRPGGLLVVDNTDWLPEPDWAVPEGWRVAHRSVNVVTETTIWRKPI